MPNTRSSNFWNYSPIQKQPSKLTNCLHCCPDYDSTLEDVVRSYAKGFLDRGHVLDLLYRSGEGKSYSFNSWIPRLTSRNFPRTISQWDSNDGLFAAGRLASPGFATQENGTTFNLKIKGYIVDTIQETDTITVASEAVSQFFQVMTQLRKFLAMVYSESDRRFTENLVQLLIGKSRRPHLDTAVTRVALQGMSSPDTTTTPPQMLWPPSFGELVVRAATQEKTNLDAFSAQLRRAVDVYWQTARVFAAHLGDDQGVVAFCATKRRFVGLVPQGAGKGDTICVIPGARVPFLIRRYEGSEKWRLIGECYIDGIMYGEGLKWSTETSFVLE